MFVFLAQAALGQNSISPRGVISAEDFSTKVGIYGWGQLAKTTDPYVDFATQIQKIGSGVVRLVAAPCFWDPRGPGQPKLPVNQLVLRADYRAVISLPSVKTVFLTVYPLAVCDGGKTEVPLYRLGVASQEQMAALHKEMWSLAFTLRDAYPGKNFIISNWEAEHDAYQEEMWGPFLSWTQECVNAVADGDSAATEWGLGGGKVDSMFEFVYLSDTRLSVATDAPSSTVQFSALLRATRQLRRVKYWSYSSWNSIHYVDDQGEINMNAFRQAFAQIRQACMDAGFDCSDKVVIGEVGMLWDADPASIQLASILRTSLEEGAQFVINWVAYDQPGEGVSYQGKWYDQSHFGKWTNDGSFTPQGEALRDWYTRGMN